VDANISKKRTAISKVLWNTFLKKSGTSDAASHPIVTGYDTADSLKQHS
jgi:hypothetical protein